MKNLSIIIYKTIFLTDFDNLEDTLSKLIDYIIDISLIQFITL